MVIEAGKALNFPEVAKCIQCGACTSACPIATYFEFSPRKIVYLTKKLRNLDYSKLWECIQCSMCSTVCPQGVPVYKLIAEIRGKKQPPSIRELVSNIMKTGVSTLPLYRSELSVKTGPKWFNGVVNDVKSRSIRHYIPATRLYATMASLVVSGTSRTRTNRIYLYPGCLALNLYPSVVRSVVDLLSILGYDIVFNINDFACCGFPLVLSGSTSDVIFAVIYAVLSSLAENTGSSLIVTPCNGCYFSLTYGRTLLRLDENIRRIVHELISRHGFKTVYDTPILLVSDIVANRVNELGVNTDAKLAVFYGCHYRAVFSYSQVMPTNLEKIAEQTSQGIVHYFGEHSCCGGFSLYNPLIAKKLSLTMLRSAKKEGAKFMVLQCLGCLMNMNRVATRSHAKKNDIAIPIHVAQLLMYVLSGSKRYVRELSFIKYLE